MYITPPWGIAEQEIFLNGAAEVEFPTGDPEALMQIILETEEEMGRHRVIKWGPRLIDIDILDYERQSWASKSLSLPHPWLHKRSFVLLPLTDLIPDWIPPGQEKTIAEFLAGFPEAELTDIERLATGWF